MKMSAAILLFFLYPLSLFAADQSCKFSLDPSSVQVNWIAYKTTEKVAVQGSLKEVAIQGASQPLASLKALIQSLKAEGQVDRETKSDTGNPGRDLTLFQKYFSLISKKAAFSGTFKDVSGNDRSGDLQLFLAFNGKKKNVPMKYAFSEEGNLEVTGSFNMLDFSLASALKSIHQACESMHAGQDGVSKTWPDVGLKIFAKIQKDCKK